MTIQLSPEQEHLVGQAINAGLIRVPDDVVGIGVETIRQRLEASKTARETASATPNAEEWSRELHAWIRSHPTTTPVLSDEAISRDSIYDSRGL